MILAHSEVCSGDPQPKPKSKLKPKPKVRDQRRHRECFLLWMEIPVNFGVSLWLEEGRTSVGLVMGSKNKSCEKMAVHVNSEMKNGKLLIDENVRQRTLRYRRAYFTVVDSGQKDRSWSGGEMAVLPISTTHSGTMLRI